MIRLKSVPGRIRIPVGVDTYIQKTINNFFLETKNYLESEFGKSPHFEIKYKEMELSDNRITYLLYKDHCVAGVFERRTEFNNLEYIFFRDLSKLERLSK